MKVEFLGKTVATTSAGCSACGHSRTARSRRIVTSSVAVPSGAVLSVRAHQPVDVSAEDGKYLLGLTYEFAGKQFGLFKAV